MSGTGKDFGHVIAEANKRAVGKEAVLITSGDLRLSANQTCWPAQAELEKKLEKVFEAEGVHLRRAFPYDAVAGHGFIRS